MPRIVTSVFTVMEECNEWLNAFRNRLITVVTLITDVAAEAEVPLEKLPPKAGVQPSERAPAIITLAPQCHLFGVDTAPCRLWIAST